ncbi:RlpA-like double-psi beta-barrel-protein domain-containing protein-containing protein [Cubamyces menziesii]|nr:RlpA-like double-psi beta-barrel-protein domain-containing protein-containing protein [Cubamyces menziesii]
MFFSKTLVVLSVALSALASPHMPRGASNHHGIARRAAMPVAEPEPVMAAPLRKRSDSKRCKVRSTTSVASSTAAATVAISAIPQNVESDPASSATPTSTPENTPTPTSHKQTPTSTPTPTSHSSSSSAAPQSTQGSSGGDSGSNSGGPSWLTGTQSGDGTYYATGLGACGIVNHDTDYIAAVSHLLFDNYPGYNGVNPNNNPVCNRQIKANYQGKSVTITVTDRCTGCAVTDLDFSPSAFSQLADFAVGRLHGMTWEWV